MGCDCSGNRDFRTLMKKLYLMGLVTSWPLYNLLSVCSDTDPLDRIGASLVVQFLFVPGSHFCIFKFFLSTLPQVHIGV